jgi:hypothetical protein
MLPGITKAEKDLIAIHREALKRYLVYKCSSCGQAKLSHVEKPAVEICRQKSRLALATTYLLCADCQKLPEKTIRANVRATLIANRQILPDFERPR